MFAMKVVLALLIAVLCAIEVLLFAWLGISLFVPPGGSGEFTGINQLGYSLRALYLPFPTFVLCFVIVLVCYTPKNRKAFLGFACGLIVALATVFPVLIMTEGSKRPWHLIVNAVIAAVWTAVVLFLRLTGAEISFKTSA